MNVKGITNNLQNFLITHSAGNVGDADINKIINITLPMKQIDSLIKITNHTNENLDILKTNLIKNRNLMAEEISCLNEVFEDPFMKDDASTSQENLRDTSNTRTSPIRDEVSDASYETLHSDYQNEDSDMEDTENVSNSEDYETKKILQEVKKMRTEVLESPPSLDFDLTKFK